MGDHGQKQEIRFADLFGGIGGFRIALEKAGQKCADPKQRHRGTERRGKPLPQRTREGNRGEFHCVWYCDNDKYAVSIYNHNFKENYAPTDIKGVEAEDLPDFDLLCAGFPCQSFSVAGRRQGFQDTRGTLFFEICRVASAKKPRMLFLENVKGLLNHDEGRTFATILVSLDELGYDVEWQVLNSKDFGVPQNRERVFIVGHLRGAGGQAVFPLGEGHKGHSEEDQKERNTGEEIQTDISQAVKTGTGCLRDTESYIVSNPHGFNKGGRRRLANVRMSAKENEFIILDNKQQQGELREYHGVTPALTRKMGTGGNNIPLVANAVDCDGYLRRGERPRDEAGKPQLLPIGYQRIRRLTPIECERLQGFPDGWTNRVSDTQRYKCLGNAVTVNVVEAIGERILLRY